MAGRPAASVSCNVQLRSPRNVVRLQCSWPTLLGRRNGQRKSLFCILWSSRLFWLCCHACQCPIGTALCLACTVHSRSLSTASTSLVQIRPGLFLPGPRQACRTAAHYNNRYLTKLAASPPPSIGSWPRISCQVPAPFPLPVAILACRHHLQRSWSGAGGSLLRQGALDRYPP
ncbi:hypothetical protein IWX49DRAFT_206685 [Phyllosticta citricarpa]